MITVEIFYNGEVDDKTPEVAEKVRYTFGDKVDVSLVDTSSASVPEKYGTINPPTVIVDGRQKIAVDGPDSVVDIVSKAIF